jgi:hypothetical protein
MKNFLMLTLFGTILLIACKSSNDQAAVIENETGYQYFGEKIENLAPKNLSELITDLQNQDSVYTQVKAQVESVCQAKGCWMNLVESVESGESDPAIFVKFKDYAYFMPKDIAGKTVVIQGYAYREVTSVDELKHYAEDEGKSQEEIDKITEPVEELKFMADGVILL